MAIEGKAMNDNMHLGGRRGGIPWRLIGWGTAFTAALLTFLVNGAVGMIGDEDNRYNLVFLGVVALALLGSIIARFRAEGMVRAMTVATVAQVIAGLYGLTMDVRGGIFSAIFAGLWLLSAFLFAKAAQAQEPVSTAA